jgi:hypothetical protein
MDSPALISVQFACNDDDGDPAEVARAVDWRSNGIIHNYPPLHLEGDLYGDGTDFSDWGSEVCIAGKAFPYVTKRIWAGNRVWNEHWFRPPVAKALLRHLKESGEFTFDSGPERLRQWWDSAP